MTGLDMTEKMLTKARANLEASKLTNMRFEQGYAEALDAGDELYDCIVSNGVINLTPHKSVVFASIAKALRPGGRLMFSDIVTGVELPESVRENCELWAECIGGAQEQQRYLRLIESAGMKVESVAQNDTYEFSEGSTADAARRFQVRSIRILAYQP